MAVIGEYGISGVSLREIEEKHLRKSAEYVLNPPLVACRDHPGYEWQFESQTTLIEHARNLAINYLRDHPKGA